MAFTNTNDWITGRITMRTPSGSEVCSQRFEIALGTGDLSLNTAGQIGWLPPGCVPVDVHVDATDMDSGAAAMVLQVGVLNAANNDLSADAADGGGAWGATAASNTAFLQRITHTLRNMAAVVKSDVPRKLGVKVATAPTTAVAGTLGVTLFYRAAV